MLEIRKDFPILDVPVHNKPFVYLDNAATTLKPNQVVDRMSDFMKSEMSNIHRGVHYYSEKATKSYEAVRTKIKKWINANSTREICFTSGATHSLNQFAISYAEKFLREGDEVIISYMEHHSNIVPWQILRDKKKLIIKVIPINDNGELELEAFEKLITNKTKLLSVVYISNSLGTINPIEEMVKISRQKNIHVMLDCAQVMGHFPIDVKKLDIDFLVFSAHKFYGPTGVGVMWGREDLLKEMPPVFGGGDMIINVTFEHTDYNTLPYKFEAGTPPIAEVIGMGASIDYLLQLGYEQIRLHEDDLFKYANDKLSQIEGLTIIGCAEKKASVFSFTLRDIHPHDIGTLIDQQGVAIRTGHHCTQPIMKLFNIPATARASLGIYNQKEDIDILSDAILKTQEIFS